MKRIILSVIAAILICASGFAISTEARVHDPVMIKQGDTYYVLHTGNGVSIITSKDMINWQRQPSIFKKGEMPAWHRNDIPDQNGHLWAPDIHYRDGKYWVYYSVSAWMNFNSSIGLVTNTTLDPEDPNYEWKDEGMIISYKNGGEGVNVIDPNVFVDEDGRVYLFYGSYKAGLRMVELNPETGKLPDDDKPDMAILTTSLGEGVFVVKHDGYYYIFASRGKCCAGVESTYQIVIGRSKDIKGPYLNKKGESWTYNNYTLFLAGDYDEPGRGHNGFFTENGQTYIVYHAYTRSADGASLLNIKPVYVGSDGWPTLEDTGVKFNAIH